jgi:hypothetical protein
MHAQRLEQAQRLESITRRESARRAEDFDELVSIRAEQLREQHREAKERSEGFADKVSGGWAVPILSRTPIGTPLMVAATGLNAVATGKAMYHEWRMNRAEKDAERDVAQELERHRAQWSGAREAVRLDLDSRAHGDGEVGAADRVVDRSTRQFERERG